MDLQQTCRRAGRSAEDWGVPWSTSWAVSWCSECLVGISLLLGQELDPHQKQVCRQQKTISKGWDLSVSDRVSLPVIHFLQFCFCFFVFLLFIAIHDKWLLNKEWTNLNFCMFDVIPESLYIPSTMPISSINAEQHFSTRGTEKSKELAHIYTTSQKILLMILPVNIICVMF